MIQADLTVFLDQWKSPRQKDDLYSSLSNFVEQWNSCQRRHLDAPVRPLNMAALKSFFSDFAPLLRELQVQRRDGKAANVWEAAGLGADEVRVSSVLAWFLDCHAAHGQGNQLLSLILDAVVDMPAGFPSSEKVRAKPYWVHVESCASGDRTSRVDIEIEGEAFLLFIEVKVYAAETNDQLKRYLKIARQKGGGRPYGVLFLTLPGKRASIQDPFLVNITWQDVAHVFRAQARLLTPGSNSRSLLSQFAQHITGF
ncbi:PD-(D/E)XK nuclease family protein [Geomonas sp. Red69]|uniref:PDDEXK-like family protein n=1 Tax=Geomonas diazotrophica TaxID=2843197 RepID=UPI001C104D7B|nr:PD-(D/E)XK nuclease family protein [Geomonas diazotrophica]MBU5638734.1 PD-(D/E)XK nuclease family protein [Geomonas diazotrophica]